MGCCLSSRGQTHEAEQRRSIQGEPPTSPPAILEVETVKEVLLETPIAPKTDVKIKSMPPGNQEWKPEARLPEVVHGKDDGETVSEVSGITEVCSYSASLSTATAQGKGADVDDGVVDQLPPPRKRRAHVGGRGKGERVVARRTAAPSPEKRRQVAPLLPVHGKPMASQPRNGPEENGNSKRKDIVEGSGRRPRSPARKEEVDLPRNENDQKVPAAAEPRNDVVQAEETETLENPVVSLECFIFL